MSEHVRAALATIVEGGTLTLDEARLAMGAVMDGEATPAQLAALLMGLRMRGETVDELAGLRDRHARAGRARGGARGHRRCRRDRRRRQRHVQHLDRRPRSSSRRPACRSPSTATARSRRRPGSADVLDALGVRIDHDAASAAAALRRVRLRVPVRPDVPSGDAARRPDPQRDRRADGVQPARTADQPGGHAPAAARRRRRAGGRAVRRGRPSTRHRADARGPRRRGRRAAARRHGRPVRGDRRTASSSASSTPRRSGCGRRRPRSWPAATRRRTLDTSRPSCAASPGRGATSCCSTPAPRSWRRARSRPLEDGIERAALTIDAGLTAELLGRLRAERIAAETAAAGQRAADHAAPRGVIERGRQA